jgi:uncharacterized protein YukE
VYSKGADVDALRDSAGRMASFGREVDQVLARGRHAVSVVQRAWAGPDLGPVLERWRRVEADLTRIGDRFGDLSRRLEHNADAQQRSSAGHGGAGGHGSGHGGSGGSGRPLVGATQWRAPHPGAGMGWGQVVGAGGQQAGPARGAARQAFAPAGWAPLTPAFVPALAAHRIGLPTR